MGEIAGGILAMVLFSMLFSTFLYKSKEPIPRAVATVLTVWVVAVTIYGLNSGNFLAAAIIYGIGAPVAFWERKRHYEKHWVDESVSDLSETFR